MKKLVLSLLLLGFFFPALALAQSHGATGNAAGAAIGGAAGSAATATSPTASTATTGTTCDGSFSVTELFQTDGLLPPFLRTSEAAQNAGFDCLTASIRYYTSMLLFVVGIMAFFYMLYGSFLYMTAFGDEAKAQQAKKVITQALIGLVIASLAYTIVIILNTTLSGPALHLTN